MTKPYGSGDTSWFVKDRFGMFIHWGLYALPARHEWIKHKESITDADYQKYFGHFNPDLYDPRKWARAAREAGMKYCVITTKHHEGFCLWDSKHTDYKAPNTPCGKDLLAPMVEAFRGEGIKVGFYYSLIDWHHPQFTIDRLHPRRDDQDFRQAQKGRDITIYAQYMRDQVKELLTSFGKIDIIWFDFSYPGADGKGRDDWESEELIRTVRGLAPNIMVNNRLDLPGANDFVTPEQYQPIEAPVDDACRPVVWEACQTFSGSWGYFRDELTWKSVDQILWMLIDGVSKNGNLLLNVGPTGRGEFDGRAMQRLEGIGRWMSVHGRSIYGCGAAPREWIPPADCRYTYNAETNRLYVHLMAWPYRSLHLKGLCGKIAYAQFLHDASEVIMEESSNSSKLPQADARPEEVRLALPVVKPDVAVPVIELFMKL